MGYLWMMTLGKIKCESFQTAFAKNSHPLQGALSTVTEVEEAKGWGIPLLRSTNRLEKKRSTMWTETPALKAMKEHGVDKQHLAWISKLREQHGLQMRPGHVGSNNSKRQGDSRKERQKAQWCSHCWLTQCKQRWTKMVEQRERLQTGRMVFPKRGIRGRHCGIGNIKRSSGTHDFGPHRRFQRQRPGDRPCKNKLELNAQAKGTMAKS